MLKKVLTVPGIVAVLVAVFLLGSLSLGTVFAKQNTNPPAQATVQSVDNGSAEATVLDTDNVENQVEQDGEFDGEF